MVYVLDNKSHYSFFHGMFLGILLKQYYNITHYYKFWVSWNTRKSLPEFDNLFSEFLMQGVLKYGRNLNYNRES